MRDFRAVRKDGVMLPMCAAWPVPGHTMRRAPRPSSLCHVVLVVLAVPFVVTSFALTALVVALVLALVVALVVASFALTPLVVALVLALVVALVPPLLPGVHRVGIIMLAGRCHGRSRLARNRDGPRGLDRRG